jgi:hypothetical protein
MAIPPEHLHQLRGRRRRAFEFALQGPNTEARVCAQQFGSLFAILPRQLGSVRRLFGHDWCLFALPSRKLAIL